MATGDATLMYSFPQWHPLSQPSPVPNCHRVQVNRKKYRRRRKRTCFCYSSQSGSRSTCNMIIALSLFLILIVVITIAAMAIYIGMEIILDGSLRVTYGDYYTAELYNRSSQLFLTKAHTYKIMIEKVFARSILGPSVKQCVIMGFKNGSLIVFYRLILDRRKIPSRTFVNLEENAKKILFEEITSLKPAIFNNIRLDPKQIILKKHTLSAETQIETITEQVLEETPATTSHPHGVLRRITYTTPAILRRRIATPSILPVTTTVTVPRSKNMKKHRQPTVEKASKIKFQLDSTRSSILTQTSVTSKPVETKRNQNFDVNGSVNRYSFVSDDVEQMINLSVSANGTETHGFGEAEAIVIPVSNDADYLGKSENISKEVGFSRRENRTHEIRNSVAKVQKLQFLGSPNNTERPHLNLNTTDNIFITNESVNPSKELSLNVPTRSNVGLQAPLRPRPVPEESVKNLKNKTRTVETTTNRTDTTTEEIPQTTENALIVLNTEVVTSTSMKVSYGEAIFDDEIDVKENLTDSRAEDAPVITHNVQSMSELGGTKNQPKYKNIFPRSIRDVNYEKTFDNRSTKTSHISPHLSSIIDKYKKQPSNETLHQIIQQLASMYTKGTTLASALTTKINSLKLGYGGLLTRPFNRISSTSTTTEMPKNVSVCDRNGTKQCSNGQCILAHLWCNQFADCNDGSDEKNCTCTDYLKAQYSHKKICDGIVDCWDFSDENQCEWCAADMFVCTNAKLCIEQNKVCDGYKDCPSGDDEKNCITISQFQKNNDLTYHSTGVVIVRRAGQWGKLCYKKNENEQPEHALKSLKELGKAVCKTMTFRHFNDIRVINDSHTDSMPTYYRLTQIEKNNTSSFRRKHFKFVKTRCENKEIVQVSCSGLECGTQTQIGTAKVRGRYRGDRQSRIVGGGSAILGAWPWKAALYKEGEFQCGATLISSKWLLSAGHCFNNALHDYWVARLGILRRSSTLPSPHEQIRPIRRIIVHPQYADAGFINDISLLEMNSEIQFTNFVRPICLPNTNHLLQDGTLCTVIGWGQLMESGGIYPDTLQEVQLPVISPSECHKRTVLLPLYKITDGMLCAGFDRGGRDACLGDSGGPLMCQDDDDAWHLFGVTSNGNGCARAYRPGVYTKVANYISWIESHLKSNMTKIVPTPHCSGYRCPLGECLPKARICNGYMECSDGSDEREC